MERMDSHPRKWPAYLSRAMFHPGQRIAFRYMQPCNLIPEHSGVVVRLNKSTGFLTVDSDMGRVKIHSSCAS